MQHDEINYLSQLKLIDDELELVFSERKRVTAPDNNLFAYHFKMKNKKSGDEMGEINIKAGYNENIINYRGNIGFTVYKNYRGHHYSGRSCILLIPVIKFLKLNPIWITCNIDNHASRKNIEKIGAVYIETTTISETSPYFQYYPVGARKKLKFKWEIK